MIRHVIMSSFVSLLLFTGTAFDKKNNPSSQYIQQQDEPAIVMVLPINYVLFDLSDVGLSNEYLQEKIITELNSTGTNNYHFYTKKELEEMEVQPDLILAIDLNSISIGELKNTRESLTRSKSVKNGSENPRQQSLNGYTLYSAKINLLKSSIESSASLEYRIYEPAAENTILSSTCSEKYKWEQQSASYTGDYRAFETGDWTIINTSSTIATPPSQEVLAKTLIDICSKKMLKKIKSELSLKK